MPDVCKRSENENGNISFPNNVDNLQFLDKSAMTEMNDP